VRGNHGLKADVAVVRDAVRDWLRVALYPSKEA
jgi:hypothetical protein